jgi:hypothetical protein
MWASDNNKVNRSKTYFFPFLFNTTPTEYMNSMQSAKKNPVTRIKAQLYENNLKISKYQENKEIWASDLKSFRK